MALFNKLFSSRKRNYNKCRDNVCEKLFQFTNEQVRVVLFRECDFRGRKLLFDSQAIQKVPLVNQSAQQEAADSVSKEKEKKIYAEIYNGYGYLYSKPDSDIPQLSEMVFGSVAMSYRGTSYKIHTLTSPPRFMCTQVFPCPRQPMRGGRNSAPGRTSCGHHHNNYNGISSLSLERSTKFDDSCTSCTTSFSDQSVHSTASDTLLVCRRNRSVPLDVPMMSNGYSSNIPSFKMIGDSGFSGEQSYGSTSSGPQSFPNYEAQITNSTGNINFSCGSLYKRWLRSTSTSLELSTSSLTGSASADECFIKPHPRTTKLGLAIVIQLTSGQEENLQRFLLEHAALIDAMVWRVRYGSEVAFLRHVNFLSLMSEVTADTSKWLITFLTGPHLSLHMWRSLSTTCDNSSNSINNRTYDIASNNSVKVVNSDDLTSGSSFNDLNSSVSSDSLTNSLESSVVHSGVEKSEYTFLNLSRFFRNDCDVKKSDSSSGSNSISGCNRSFFAEKFIRELCELLESVDVKHTNFFISTLVTAVLTHHLGWVATVLERNQDDEEAMKKLQNTGNPLWGQLNDLYGAVGCPTKMAHTVITGSNKPELITKILNSLTYFIRCNDVFKKSSSRWDVLEENNAADQICKEKHCIPKENYKKYQDHLKEIADNNGNTKKIENFEQNDFKFGDAKNNQVFKFSELKKFDEIDGSKTLGTVKEEITCMKPSKGLTLTKTTTCLNELSKLAELENEDSIEDNVSNNTLSRVNSTVLNSTSSTPKDQEHFGLTNEDIHKKVQTLFRGLKDVPTFRSSPEIQRLEKIDLEKQRSSPITPQEKNKGVVFVLGENEELVGLKSTNSETKFVVKTTTSENSKENIPNPRKPLTLNISEKSSSEFNSTFKDSDFIKYQNNYDLKPSTSWTHLNAEQNEQPYLNHEATCSTSTTNKIDNTRSFSRAQSEPPEHAKTSPDTSKPRFRYTGVKFNFQQHPQIFTNYMRSKNIELSNLSFAEKSMKFNGALSTNFDFSNYENNFDEVEPLQTPSNASELEFTSELGELAKIEAQHAKESNDTRTYKTFKRNSLSNTVIKEASTLEIVEENLEKNKKIDCVNAKVLNLIEVPMPKSLVSSSTLHVGYTSSLFRGISECYTSDMVLQGISVPKTVWETSLRKDLTLTARHPLLDQPIEEAVAIVADTDTWDVQLISSHTYVIDKGTSGVRIGMSQLVANMLESLLHMWKLHTSPEHCLMHIEQRLQEFCTRSKALAQMLLTTDFCSMEHLTTSLQLEVNDIPLLMAVASTHSPQITQKYGLSFQ